MQVQFENQTFLRKERQQKIQQQTKNGMNNIQLERIIKLKQEIELSVENDKESLYPIIYGEIATYTSIISDFNDKDLHSGRPGTQATGLKY